MASSRKRQPPANAAPDEANAALSEPRRTPGRFRAIVYAALVHAIVVAALIIGFSWSSAPTVAPENTIQAVVAEDPEKKQQEEERRRRQEEERKAEVERKRQEVEAQKKEEERRLEERRKQAEAEKQKQAEAKRKEEERKKTEAEAQRKRAEAEARKKREEEAQSRKVAEDSLKQQLADEERARAQAASAARAASQMQKYSEMIRRHVSQRWNKPDNAPTNLKCLVKVEFAPGTWEVVKATVVRSTGNRVWDESVERAVLAATPFPLPKDAELFEHFRELQFEFTLGSK